MKVAMVSTAKNRGGAARMAMTLAKGIQNLDSSISMTFYHAEDNQQADGVKGLKKPLLRETNALLARLGGARCVLDGGVAEQIIAETQNADLLHIHNLHGYYLNYEKLLRAWRDRPIVWTWHDMWGATGRCGYSLECTGWQSGCLICPHKEYYPTAWLDFASAEFAAKTHLFSQLQKLVVVSPSQWLADIATARNVFQQPVQVIPNPVNTDQYQVINAEEAKSQLGLDIDKQYILFIAADCNNANKGYADFLQIIEQGQLYGIAVGIPPENQSKRIVYPGAIGSPQELSKYYSAAELMVITSKQDNYPNTVMESMACGTPVMGYAVGGIPSQLPASWEGLVPLNDIQQMLNKIIPFLRNDGKTAELQNMFRTHVEENADLRVISGRYFDLYNYILTT